MRISKNTLRVGREAGYYNPVDAFRFRAEILPELEIKYNKSITAPTR